MAPLIDLTGVKFGMLTVIDRNYEKPLEHNKKQAYWNCLCDCGNYSVVAGTYLIHGHTKSCGCYGKQLAKTNGKKNKRYNDYDISDQKYGTGYTRKGEPFYFDVEDYDLIKKYCWTKQKGYIAAYDGPYKPQIRMHRLIMSAPDNCVVDHINGDKTDNRKENLRLCQQNENARNRKRNKNNTSGVTGVRFHRQSGKWVARIKVNYRYIALGSYDTMEEAVIARKAGEEKYFGKFSYTNSRRDVCT